MPDQTEKTLSNKVLALYAFLLPSLLLTTPNWSVGVTLLLLIYAMASYRKWAFPELFSLESLLFFTFAFNFIAGFPSYFHGEFDIKILDMGVRYLLMIPLFLFLLGTKNSSLYKSLIMGAIIGSIGAFALAAHEYFYLHHIRVQGFKNIIFFGFLAVSLMFLLLASITVFNNRKSILSLIIAASIISTFTVFSTATKGAIIAIPILSILIGILYRDRLHIRVITLAIVATTIIFFTAYSTMDTFKSRISQSLSIVEKNIFNGKNDIHSSTGTRIEMLRLAYLVLKDSPLTGMSYRQRSSFYTTLVENNVLEETRSEKKRSTNAGHAHNEIMESAASKGIWGIIGVLLLYTTPLIYFSKHLKSTDSEIYTISRTGIIFVAGYIIFGITETPLKWNLTSIFYPTTIMLLWVSIRSRTGFHNEQINP
jgi:O-antigen ligase